MTEPKVDPYKDNPQAGEIRRLTVELEEMTRRRTQWEEYYDNAVKTKNEEIAKLRAFYERERSMQRFMGFLTGIFMLLWMVTVVALIVVPPYLFFFKRIPSDICLLMIVGVVLGVIWMVTADYLSTRK